jgi:glycosyltransferase involved in cell wall biosynthesis
MSGTVFCQTREPEIIYSGNGKIITYDGREIQGEIEYSFVSSRKIYYQTNGSKKENIPMKDVKEFFIDDLHFVKLATTALAIGDDQDIAIVKTPENNKIMMYEVISQGIIGTGEIPAYETERDYVVLFPGQSKPKPISDLAFMPFNKKVSKLVADCPELSKKIENKEEGYKLGIIGNNKEAIFNLFLKISDEYENCK